MDPVRIAIMSLLIDKAARGINIELAAKDLQNALISQDDDRLDIILHNLKSPAGRSKIYATMRQQESMLLSAIVC